MKKISLALVFMALSSFASADRYWPTQELVDWGLSLNNGVAYITSPQIPSHCEYSRMHINMSGTEFDKAQYAYALSAKAREKKLKYVIDSDATKCAVSGLLEVD